MIKKSLFLLYCSLPLILYAQNIQQVLSVAVNKLENDTQFSHAIISMYVVDSKTGKLVYEKNGQFGLAPASCQKIITSASAFELLGKEYTYKTVLGYDGTIGNNSLNGNLYIVGNGDPTLGSWRWKETNEDYITKKIMDELKKLHINSANAFVIDNTKWGTETLPDGWIWEDIGNYYGAGCGSFNWHENQYDIVLKPGKKIGDSVEILSPLPMGLIKIVNELKTAEKGSGDQAYVYHAPYSLVSFIRGTIPLGTDSFIVKASSTDAAGLFQNKVLLSMYQSGIPVLQTKTVLYGYLRGYKLENKMEKTIFTFVSPSLDSINYWFLKKSVNLFGEAFVKTIAYEKTKNGSTDTGISVIRDFWSKNEIDKAALKIIDGSGLSPANRVTTEALVKIMQYARTRSWFASFYNALPEMNGIKMKDGYISGVRSYTGYIKNKSGIEYTFSFIVNNFDGNPGTVREKIWKVLDVLK